MNAVVATLPTCDVVSMILTRTVLFDLGADNNGAIMIKLACMTVSVRLLRLSQRYDGPINAVASRVANSECQGTKMSVSLHAYFR